MSEISVSLDEMQALRARLGLPPLLPKRAPPASGAAAAAAAAGAGAAATGGWAAPLAASADPEVQRREAAEAAAEVRRRVERAKTARLRAQQVEGGTLADADAPAFDVGKPRGAAAGAAVGAEAELVELDARAAGIDVDELDERETYVLEDESVLEGGKVSKGRNALVGLKAALGRKDAAEPAEAPDSEEVRERRKRFREDEFARVSLGAEPRRAAPGAEAPTATAAATPSGARLHDAEEDDVLVAQLTGAGAAGEGAAKKAKRSKAGGAIIPKIVRRAAAPARNRVAGADEVDDELEGRAGQPVSAATKLDVVRAVEEDDDELQQALARTRRAQARLQADESDEAAASRARELEREAAERALADRTEIVLSEFARVDAAAAAAPARGAAPHHEVSAGGAAEAAAAAMEAMVVEAEATGGAPALGRGLGGPATDAELPDVGAAGEAGAAGGARAAGAAAASGAPEASRAPKPKRMNLSASLAMLRETGAIAAPEIVVGRASDHRLDAQVNRPGDRVVLEYRDAEGHLLTTEEAFRQQQYQYRGQAPGAKKQERRAEQIRRDEAMLAMPGGDTPLGTAKATKDLLERTKSAGIVLSKR